MDSLTYYGHAALGLVLNGYHILIDPFFTENKQASVKAEDVEADFILVSHGHFDHLGDAEAIAKRTQAQVIAGGDICAWLSNKGVKARMQQIGGEGHYPFGCLKLTVAIHSTSLPDGTRGGLACGFLITPASGKKIYVAGDTALFGDMRLIGEEGIDLAVLPIGDFYTMGPADALRAVKLIQPRLVIPYHYNSLDNIKQNGEAWKAAVEAQTSTRVLLLKPDETVNLE